MEKKRKSSLLLAGILGTLLCMSFALGSCSGKTKKTEATYSSELGTFSLEVEVDKTGMNLFETLTVKTTLKNLSGRDIYVELTDYQTYLLGEERNATPENVIQVALLPKNISYTELLIAVSPRDRVVLEKGAVITHTEKVKAAGIGSSKLFSKAAFYVGEDLDSEEPFTERVSIYPEELDIFVRLI